MNSGKVALMVILRASLRNLKLIFPFSKEIGGVAKGRRQKIRTSNAEHRRLNIAALEALEGGHRIEFSRMNLPEGRFFAK